MFGKFAMFLDIYEQFAVNHEEECLPVIQK